MKEKDWEGCIIKPLDGQDGHVIKITKPWNTIKLGKVWQWKCEKCFFCSGIFNDAEIERLDRHGLLHRPNNKKTMKVDVSHPNPRSDKDWMKWQMRD